MPDTVPPWLANAESKIGKFNDGQDVVRLAQDLARAFPSQASYWAQARSITPWCGVFVAHELMLAGIDVPGPRADGVGPMYVDWWLDFGTEIPVGQEQLGDLALWLGNPHHVSFVAGDGQYIGGNQSDGVTRAHYRTPDAIRRPPAPSVQPIQLPSQARPEIKLGDTGPYVVELQKLLGITVTGIFDSATDAAVGAFQANHRLDVDGIVGEQTWPALLASVRPKSAGLPQEAVDRIVASAGSSEIARYSWADRSVAPPGYIKGMAVTFGHVYAKLKAGDSAARAMVAPVGNGDRDALAWYDVDIHSAGMGSAVAEIDILRHLFVLLYGLGMRESSGRYCEGRDRSATNSTADTAEAGLFQMSWNASVASQEISKLFAAYSARPEGFLSIFQEGVTVREGDLENFGEGEGAEFQRLAKSCPAFAVETAAVGLRVLRKHWGPINRHEAEVRPEADRLLRQVQAVVDAIVVPIDGEILPPIVGQDDLMLMLLFFILSEEKATMDANTRAMLLAELNKPTPDMRALLLQFLGGKPALPPPTPPPPPVVQIGQGLDLTQLLPLLQAPAVQKLLGGKAITITDLLPLLPVVLSMLNGQPVPALPPPSKEPEPVEVVPPASKTAFNWSAGIGGALASLGLSAGGIIGDPVGPDATKTGMLLPLISLAAGAFGIPAPVVSVAMNIFNAIRPAPKPKA